jgi:hypothetical protein
LHEPPFLPLSAEKHATRIRLPCAQQAVSIQRVQVRARTDASHAAGTSRQKDCLDARMSAMMTNEETMETVPDYEEPDNHRNCLYTLLVGGILMTLPLYCSGILLITTHQEPTASATPSPYPSTVLRLVTPTQTGTPTFAPTLTPTPSRTPYIPRMTTTH